jgi:rod shape-determining protein MreD
MNSASQSLASIMAVLLMLALESPLLLHLELSFFAPDLALIAVVWIALHMNTVSGALTCSVIGFLKDGFVMGTPVGMHMAIYAILFHVIRLLAGKLQVRGVVTMMVTVGVASLLSTGLFALLSLIFDKTFDNYELVFNLMVPLALVTAPFGPMVFYLMDRIDGLFTRKTPGLFSR